MAACGFADYEHLFKEHNISGDRLLQLTSEDLKDMGFVTVGDRLVMQQEIAGLRAGRRIAWRSESFNAAEPSEAAWCEEVPCATRSEPLEESMEAATRKAKRKALRSQRSAEASRSAAALSALRNDLRTARCQKYRIACSLAEHRALLDLAAPFHAWRQHCQEARHASRLQSELEAVNCRSLAALRSARCEVKAARLLSRWTAQVSIQRRCLLFLAPVLHGWSRQVQSTASSRRLRPGEVLLNSGEAAKRAQQQLQQARAQHAQQMTSMEKELAQLKEEVCNARMAAAAAVRREARVDNIARKHELAAKRGEDFAALLACIKAWMGEVVLSRSTATLRREANERLAECLARQRLESRGALHQAWSEAADASRKAAALERRLEKESGDGEVPLPTVPYDASRPSTALEVEDRLRRLDAAKEADASAPVKLGTAEVLTIESSVDAEVLAAREGRKGLFIAALQQQAKYWQAEAFNAWCRVFLQDRCQRLKSLLESRKKASAPATPRKRSMKPLPPEGTQSIWPL